ncbi:MAG TPA: Gfo/Idh/MocA family oxidoreductase [Bryobacteraceae bacterium]|nr:Gfo/Idh/MocA family oxidoreductase [Bryobacteraceae bacterium]HPT26005.1 Gfo/Idh/MocA family oxidoreductase [Bryobacteraceae bacterium]
MNRREILSGAAPLIVSAQTAFGTQANSAASFGIIGTGNRGIYVGGFMAGDKNARLAAICDKYPDRIDLGKSKIPGADKVPAYRDYRRLLDDKSLDAVLISTPVHLHPEHLEAAVQVGKHVYCEKPAGADVAGCKKVLEIGDKADRGKTIQFGFQQRYAPEYLTARDYVKSGRIGEMKLMMSYWVLGGLASAQGQNIPPDRNEEDQSRNWAKWEKYSGGPLVEQDCHGIDTMNWFAGDIHPVKCTGSGGLRYQLRYGDWKTDHHNITFSYPNGVEGWLTSIKFTAGYRDVREQFFGSKGMIETSRKYYKLHAPEGDWRHPNGDDLRDKSLIEKRDSAHEITIDAVASFFKSIVEEKPCHTWKLAAESTLSALMGRMAVHEKRGVAWDEILKSA